MVVDRKFKNEILAAHARCRTLHGLPSLGWDDGCQKAAEKWAREIQRTRIMEHGGLIHPNGEKMGQNLAMISGTQFKDLAGDRATFMWYNECVDPGYQYGRRQNPGTGHFTQVVWRGSTHVGAARVKAGNKSFVVANYIPAGNFVSRYEANVPLPISGMFEEVMTMEMRDARAFKKKYGDAGLNIRTSTTTSTRTTNGITTVTKTVKTFHNDELVKITVNGVEQPLEWEERNDLRDDRSLMRANDLENQWRRDNYIVEGNQQADSYPQHSNYRYQAGNQPPMVVNPGIRQQKPVSRPVMAQSLRGKSSDYPKEENFCACNLI